MFVEGGVKVRGHTCISCQDLEFSLLEAEMPVTSQSCHIARTLHETNWFPAYDSVDMNCIARNQLNCSSVCYMSAFPVLLNALRV